MVPWNKSGVILLRRDHAEMTESSMVTLYLVLQSIIPEDRLSVVPQTGPSFHHILNWKIFILFYSFDTLTVTVTMTDHVTLLQ